MEAVDGICRGEAAQAEQRPPSLVRSPNRRIDRPGGEVVCREDPT